MGFDECSDKHRALLEADMERELSKNHCALSQTCPICQVGDFSPFPSYSVRSFRSKLPSAAAAAARERGGESGGGGGVGVGEAGGGGKAKASADR